MGVPWNPHAELLGKVTEQPGDRMRLIEDNLSIR